MLPKEKAQMIIEKFESLLPCEGTTTGQTPIDCAIICVDLIIDSIGYREGMNPHFTGFGYWQKVKEEIKKS